MRNHVSLMIVLLLLPLYAWSQNSSTETLELVKAIAGTRYGADSLWLKVSSTATPAGSSTINASMLVNGQEVELGNVPWNSSTAHYQRNFLNLICVPETVILRSASGATLEADTGYTSTCGDTGGNIDKVTAVQAVYFAETSKLWVRGSSDATPAGAAELTASAQVGTDTLYLGNVNWVQQKGYYQKTFNNVTLEPSTVTFSSNLGGSDSVSVEVFGTPPGSNNETLEFVSAVAGSKNGADTLWIRASSDATPAGSSIITVSKLVNGQEVELGLLPWRDTKGFYQNNYLGLTCIPATVTLRSSSGATLEAETGYDSTCDDPGTTTDQVDADSAMYFTAEQKLWVRAYSDATPAGSAELTASAMEGGNTISLGELSWQPSKTAYQKTFFNIATAPSTVTVGSSLGGSDTIAVTLVEPDLPPMVIDSVTPVTVQPNTTQEFVIIGSNLPTTLLADLTGADCETVNWISTSEARVTCLVPDVTGELEFNFAADLNGTTHTHIITVEQSLAMVTGLTAEPGIDAFINLVWDEVDGAISYNVYYAQESFASLNGEISNYASLAGAALLTGVTINDLVVDDLEYNQTYYFVVTAVGSGQESEASDEANATTRDAILVTSKLNDTGITWGANYPDDINATCTSNIAAPQDCNHGRDALAAAGQLQKVGGGNAGFDFTKLDANGNDLPAGAILWSCVRDNHTGLIWEVKTDDDGLHDKDDRYTWFSTNSSTNGGHVGYENDGGGTCHGYDANNSATYCNTQAFVARVNTQSLCGASDWRMPSREELVNIVDFGSFDPAIDTNYFPNTIEFPSYWTGSPFADRGDYSWNVRFQTGWDSYSDSDRSIAVRLVRSGQ